MAPFNVKLPLLAFTKDPSPEMVPPKIPLLTVNVPELSRAMLPPFKVVMLVVPPAKRSVPPLIALKEPALAMLSQPLEKLPTVATSLTVVLPPVTLVLLNDAVDTTPPLISATKSVPTVTLPTLIPPPMLAPPLKIVAPVPFNEPSVIVPFAPPKYTPNALSFRSPPARFSAAPEMFADAPEATFNVIFGL